MYQREVSLRSSSREIDRPLRENSIRAYIHRQGINDTRFVVRIIEEDTFVVIASHRPLVAMLAKVLPHRDFYLGKIENSDFLRANRHVSV